MDMFAHAQRRCWHVKQAYNDLTPPGRAFHSYQVPIRYLKAGEYVLALRKRKYVCQKILKVTEHLACPNTRIGNSHASPLLSIFCKKRISGFPKVGYVSSLPQGIYGKVKVTYAKLIAPVMKLCTWYDAFGLELTGCWLFQEVELIFYR